MNKLVWTVCVLLLLGVAASLLLAHRFGAWHLLFPSSAHESVAPMVPPQLPQPSILLFTKTNGFRHREAIAAGTVLFNQLADGRGWGLFHAENSAVFDPELLSRFAAVVFLNVTGNSLSESQRAAFEEWLAAGGGWLGIHAAGDGSHAYWPWYVTNVIGVEFTAHILGPQLQAATVRNERTSHPVMERLPDEWTHVEEWYSWRERPKASVFDVLASVDESSYSPMQKIFGRQVDLRMGEHPVVWSRCLGQGRVVYSAMGHNAQAYAAAGHRRLLENAMDWSINGEACGK